MINKYPRRAAVNPRRATARSRSPAGVVRRPGERAPPESAVRRRTRLRHFDTFDRPGRVSFRREIVAAQCGPCYRNANEFRPFPWRPERKPRDNDPFAGA
ncbi:hypothetical protein AB0L41_25410 [Amycolatopsis mediterranei]|uniref:hypothetical protein n=1 Tax=Amycolatopsis mediterranei TaxID=33910 RepID=UPI0034287A51